MLPALAYLAKILVDMARKPTLDAEAKQVFQTLHCLGNGFIVTSLLWAAALAALLDGRFVRSGLYLLVAGGCALFGIIHSPLQAAPIDLPWNVVDEMKDKASLLQTPYHWAASYVMAAALLFVLALFPNKFTQDRQEGVEMTHSFPARG